MKNKFVANGFERWAKARDAKTRDTFRAKSTNKNQSPGIPGKVRVWFRTELECLRRQKAGGKSSPKILW